MCAPTTLIARDRMVAAAQVPDSVRHWRCLDVTNRPIFVHLEQVVAKMYLLHKKDQYLTQSAVCEFCR